jgi:hypothetical protein
MTNPDRLRTLEPVHADEDASEGQPWAYWLVVFLRAMAVVSLLKGIYHWGVVCGIHAPAPSGFDAYPTPYQAATVFFAVIDLVAGVGLWLAAPWGAVIWLTSVISMAAVEIMFPQIYGGSVLLIGIELVLLGTYLTLALMAARTQPS